MALCALGIPEDLATVLSTLDLTKLGVPAWKVQKRKNGYNVTIFWRTASRSTPFNARHHGASRRNQRSQRRLEDYLEKKRRNGEQDTVRVAGNPAGCDTTPVEPRCETPPAGASSPETTSQKQELPSTPPVSIAGNPAGCDKMPVELRCVTLSTRAETTSQKQELPLRPSATVEERDSTALMTDTTAIDLSTCSLVRYEERNSVPGVKFVAEDDEGWTPVVKGEDKRSAKKGKEKESTIEGDGSIDNPRRSNDEKLWLYRAKEVKYVEMNGTPGLTFRKGRTKHSYEWIPIASASPIATRTRTKLKS